MGLKNMTVTNRKIKMANRCGPTSEKEIFFTRSGDLITQLTNYPAIDLTPQPSQIASAGERNPLSKREGVTPDLIYSSFQTCGRKVKYAA
jgi:hypothetical protein